MALREAERDDRRRHVIQDVEDASDLETLTALEKLGNIESVLCASHFLEEDSSNASLVGTQVKS